MKILLVQIIFGCLVFGCSFNRCDSSLPSVDDVFVVLERYNIENGVKLMLNINKIYIESSSRCGNYVVAVDVGDFLIVYILDEELNVLHMDDRRV